MTLDISLRLILGIILVVSVITLPVVMIIGSLSPKSVNDDKSGFIDYPISEIKISNNTYFLECHSYEDCQHALQMFGQTHSIQSIASYESPMYKYTSGYFVITKE